MIRLVIIVLCLTMFLKTDGYGQMYSSTWKACVEDSNCVVVKGSCGWDCVNHNYKTQVNEYYNEYGKIVDCDFQEMKNPKAICVQNACECDDESEQD